MSHSFVEYKSNDIRIHDLDLWLIRHFLCRFSVDKELISFFENIEWVGPGVFIGTDFNEYVRDDQHKLDFLINSLEIAKNFISNFGTHVPLQYLMEHVNNPEFGFSNSQPTTGCVRALEAIIYMIKSSAK